jgi:uncharacterized circularly permuted ATP-grasp superfamily protein
MKFANTLTPKGQKVLKNMKTHWINMLNHLKYVVSKQKSLIVKKHLDSSQNKATQDNLVLLDNLELIFGVPYLLPMLKVMQTLTSLYSGKMCALLNL